MTKKKTTVLVTGGAGFIGSHLVDALVDGGYAVRVIDNFATGKRANMNPRATYYDRDLTDLTAIAKLFRGVDFVFHAGALARIQPSIRDPLTTFRVNAIGTLHTLIASRDAGVKRVIYSASSSVYGDQKHYPLREDMTPRPKSIYALSKLIGEDMCAVFSRLYGLSTVSLRYFNVYGPRQLHTGAYATVIGIFLSQWASGRPLTIVGDGTIRRDFTYISDVVRANLLAMRSPRVGHGEVINVGTGENRSIREVAAAVLGMSSKSIGTARRKGLIVYLPPRPGESKVTLADRTFAKRLLGWQPEVRFPEGLELTRVSYRSWKR